MAKLLYLDNPADCTITWYGRTIMYELAYRLRAAGVSPWTGKPYTRPVVTDRVTKD